MKKIISFSLYGGDQKYTIGAICNAKLAKIIYPNWVCRFYYGNSVPYHIIEDLRNLDNVELVLMNEDDEYPYMMWRFLAYDDPECEVVLSRDADSRLSFREKKLVDIFIESDFVFHDIRDHSLHMQTMGGTWGMKKGAIDSMSEMVNNSKGIKGNAYGPDQWFMSQTIFKMLSEKTLIHNYNGNPNFPIKDDDKLSDLIEPVHNQHRHFIGEVFPGNNYNKIFEHVFY